MINFITLFRLQPAIALPGSKTPIDSEVDSETDLLPQLDNHAIVTQAIAPGKAGQVKFQGSWWTAYCSQPVTLQPGQQVYVTQLQGTSLTVTTYPTPIDARSSQHFWTLPQDD